LQVALIVCALVVPVIFGVIGLVVAILLPSKAVPDEPESVPVAT